MIWYYILAYAAYCYVAHRFVMWHFTQDEYENLFYWVLLIFVIPLIVGAIYA